jgi:Flp pilus assembly protein TadG
MAAVARLRLRRRVRSEKGAELIEFALTLPLLLLVLLGIIEFGFLFQEYEVVSNAAREGARIAVLSASAGYSNTEVTQRVNDYLQAGGLDLARATPAPVVTGPTPQDLGGGKCIAAMSVTVSYQHPVPFVGGIISHFGGSFGAVTLSNTSVMRRENSSFGC